MSKKAGLISRRSAIRPVNSNQQWTAKLEISSFGHYNMKKMSFNQDFTHLYFLSGQSLLRYIQNEHPPRWKISTGGETGTRFFYHLKIHKHSASLFINLPIGLHMLAHLQFSSEDERCIRFIFLLHNQPLPLNLVRSNRIYPRAVSYIILFVKYQPIHVKYIWNRQTYSQGVASHLSYLSSSLKAERTTKYCLRKNENWVPLLSNFFIFFNYSKKLQIH